MARNARTWGIALAGLRGDAVQVDVQVAAGVPKLLIIGLPDATIGEAEHRIRAALQSSKQSLPPKRITVSLAPAELRKHGAGFDLPIVCAVLAGLGVIDAEAPARNAHIGELALTGAIRPVAGILPAVHAAKQHGFEAILVPASARAEAELVEGIRVVPVASLAELAEYYGAGPEALAAPTRAEREFHLPEAAVSASLAGDLADVVGNDSAVRAVMIAAAGGHHLAMIGPPGSGKTMLAERLPGILPDLDDDAAIEVAALRSLRGLPLGERLDRRPPLQAPHHTASAVALIGGGSGVIQPGALSLAAHGVLFLDEAPEFPRRVLDALRQPLESGSITIHRVRSTVTYPANPQLVLAANPCPCGNAGVRGLECHCSPTMQRNYLQRLSGPLLDRIDLQLRVERVSTATARLAAAGERGSVTTESAAADVRIARERARHRLAEFGVRANAQLDGALLRHASLRCEPGAAEPLDQALSRGQITMRGYARAQRVAWTLADLAGAARPDRGHIAEALFYRTRIASSVDA
jgi:magnesium chelatase family protein